MGPAYGTRGVPLFGILEKSLQVRGRCGSRECMETLMFFAAIFPVCGRDRGEGNFGVLGCEMMNCL